MLLLDTCALVWLADGGGTLSALAREALGRHVGGLYVSAVSAFEVALLRRKGRLELRQPPEEWYSRVLDFHGLRELPLTGLIAARAVALPDIHRDPCDRFIVATAQEHQLRIVTADQTIPRYPGVGVVW